jgi:hypothetical protein
MDVNADGTVDPNFDNASGTINASTQIDNYTALVSSVADAVWDEAKADHVTSTSFGDLATDMDLTLADTGELQTDWADGGRLDVIQDAIKAVTDVIPDAGALTTIAANVAAIASYITLSGTSTGGTGATIALVGGVATDNYYNGQLVVITGGTGAGQSRTILSYAASGTVATVTRNWTTTPSSDSTFIVLGSDVPAILEAGTAAAGGAASITLDSGASTTADIYNDCIIMITAGTGAGQSRSIYNYTAGRVVTVAPAWTVTPDTSSVYQIMPLGKVNLTPVAIDAIWDEVMENSKTARQFMTIMKAALAGKSTGGGSSTNNYRNDADSANRIAATVDADGNRSAVTLTL